MKNISQIVYSMGCVGCYAVHQDSSHESVKFRSAFDKTVGGLLPSSVLLFSFTVFLQISCDFIFCHFLNMKLAFCMTFFAQISVGER